MASMNGKVLLGAEYDVHWGNVRALIWFFMAQERWRQELLGIELERSSLIIMVITCYRREARAPGLAVS